jgi:hypothetical protein
LASSMAMLMWLLKIMQAILWQVDINSNSHGLSDCPFQGGRCLWTTPNHWQWCPWMVHSWEGWQGTFVMNRPGGGSLASLVSRCAYAFCHTTNCVFSLRAAQKKSVGHVIATWSFICLVWTPLVLSIMGLSWCLLGGQLAGSRG